jgi:hypothetical protein
VTDKKELPPEAEEILKKLEEEQKKKKTADKLIELAVNESYRLGSCASPCLLGVAFVDELAASVSSY